MTDAELVQGICDMLASNPKFGPMMNMNPDREGFCAWFSISENTALYNVGATPREALDGLVKQWRARGHEGPRISR